jgi:hypothetical protein
VRPDQDGIPHSVASTTKTFRSKLVDADDKLTCALATASVYAHFLSLRPRMTGAIVVEGAAGGNGAP